MTHKMQLVGHIHMYFSNDAQSHEREIYLLTC